MLHVLHQVDDTADHLSGQILEVLGHEHVGQIAADGLGIVVHPGQELAQFPAQLPEFLGGELACTETLPVPGQIACPAGELLRHGQARFHGIEGAVCRILGQADHVVESFLGVRDVGLGQLGETRVQTECIEGLMQIPGQPTQLLEQQALVHAAQFLDQPGGRFLVTGLDVADQLTGLLQLLGLDLGGLLLQARRVHVAQPPR